nr:MAG: putative coat protein [Tombusviridae sp.]
MAKRSKAKVTASKSVKPTRNAGTVSYPKNGAVTVRNAPVAKGVKIRKQSRPMQKTTKNGVVITHSEMLSSVVTSATTLTYQCNSLIANPGRSAMFPWLSTIAMNYDKYRFKRLHVSFVTNQATSVSGKVGLGFDYDSTDPVPQDRVEFFALTHHTEGPVWDSLTLPIPCDNVLRFTNTHTTTDSKLIDLGQVLFMTDQVTGTSQNIGDIIVDYEVELVAAQQALFTTSVASTTNLTAVTGLPYFPSTSVVGPALFSYTAVSSAALRIDLNQGYYLLYGLIKDTGAAGGVSVTTGSASTGVTISTTGRTSANQYTYTITLVKCSVPTGSFVITSGSNLVSDENVVLIATRVSPAVYNALVAAALD